jgi:hypothetical protein
MNVEMGLRPYNSFSRNRRLVEEKGFQIIRRLSIRASADGIGDRGWGGGGEVIRWVTCVYWCVRRVPVEYGDIYM